MLAVDVVSVPPSTTVFATVAMPTVVAPSMAGAVDEGDGAAWCFPTPPSTARIRASTAGSKRIGAVGEPMTTACTMPPGPEPDQPRVVAPSVAGPASTPHRRGFGDPARAEPPERDRRGGTGDI